MKNMLYGFYRNHLDKDAKAEKIGCVKNKKLIDNKLV